MCEFIFSLVFIIFLRRPSSGIGNEVLKINNLKFNLNEFLKVGKTVWVRARVQTSRLKGAAMCFIVARDREFTCQAIMTAGKEVILSK